MTTTEETMSGVELVPVVASAPTTLFRSEDPNEIVTAVAETANALAAVIKKQRLAVSISGRSYVRVEGWTMLGTMLGVYPVCTWTRKLENGWEARVEARTRDGAIVGAAEAECLRSERSWASRDDYALRSMAQTRATSKALRQPLGFVMAVGGFETTPAEEMPPPEAQVVEAASAARVAASNQAPASAEGGAAPTSQVGPVQTSVPASGPIATEKTAKLVWVLIGKLDKAGTIGKETLLEAIGKEYGTEDPHELTQKQASDLIDRLKARLGEE